MRGDTFKIWLQKKGCRFDAHKKIRSEGHSSLGVKLGERRSTLPLVGTHQNIPPAEVSRILHELGLHAQDLPGPMGNAASPGDEGNETSFAPAHSLKDKTFDDKKRGDEI